MNNDLKDRLWYAFSFCIIYSETILLWVIGSEVLSDFLLSTIISNTFEVYWPPRPYRSVFILYPLITIIQCLHASFLQYERLQDIGYLRKMLVQFDHIYYILVCTNCTVALLDPSFGKGSHCLLPSVHTSQHRRFVSIASNACTTFSTDRSFRH